MRLLFVLLILMLTQMGYAKTDVKKSVEQLKVNKENSQKNWEQYKSNLKIVDSNIVEVKKAIKSLKNQKKQLALNVQNVEKNKMAIETMRRKVLDHKMDEAQKLEDELKDIARLEDLLAKLNANKEKRETNLKAYNLKLDEIVKEKEAWENQKQSMADLNKTIDDKLQKAEREKASWEAKQGSYSREVAKWAKESKNAARIHKKFDDLQ